MEFPRPSSTVYRAWWWSNYLSKDLGHLSVGLSVSVGGAGVAHSHCVPPLVRARRRRCLPSETSHNMTDLAEKDCGDVYGDVSFYLANHNIPYQCSLAPNASSCTGHNAIELNSQGNIFVKYEVEMDGLFGPYQMCNPLNGWDTKHWTCLTYCETPPDCPSWNSQSNKLGWMGPTCFCENGRSNRTVGRSIRSPNHHHHSPRHLHRPPATPRGRHLSHRLTSEGWAPPLPLRCPLGLV